MRLPASLFFVLVAVFDVVVRSVSRGRSSRRVREDEGGGDVHRVGGCCCCCCCCG